ncbi:3-keto-5-aminohexanoate cleavage protein [Paracoccus nototheniae]|uniref:3-keto-5-aminohexanoate cleavage protein n=1 Tax=Paracoccus nototheniae TaxID=2489002 RepID=A0ABW4DZP6_9RHOB
MHGFDATVWHFVTRARQRRWSTRIGLEDGCHLASGDMAENNAELVSDALRIVQGVASWRSHPA